MHQYSSWSHMYLAHLVPFISDSLSASFLHINHPFHIDMFALLARQIDEC